jgi:hypothetical protein
VTAVEVVPAVTAVEALEAVGARRGRVRNEERLRQSAQRKRKDLEGGWAWAGGLVRQWWRRGRERLEEAKARTAELLRQSARQKRE